ncbi:MaoC/PaaZ C-terminal domain-containing protein [Bacillus marasmi]|uniref:MaoC/PaaZ C-terminal domain-containing protein n=1 Tax=Bacillus marasmi TaxID=1926279 RepID=UPI0011C95DA9|nr:MaoC/PaaZ C-terminal domain-containing protein [Bacillus marasmi]
MKTVEFLITDMDIKQYAHISGDHNPVHLNQEYALNHGFSDKISHGLLTMGKVWSVISFHFLNPTDLPHSYEMKFSFPVYVGESVKLFVKCDNHIWTINGFCGDRPVIKANIILKK